MSEANKDLVRRFYAGNTNDFFEIEKIVTADYHDHHFLPDLPRGPEGIKQWFTNVLASIFSDMKWEIEFMLADGDKVDCHFAFTCSHTGNFGDIPAKGNKIRLLIISTFRIKDGKIAEGWKLYDSGDMFNQMKA